MHQVEGFLPSLSKRLLHILKWTNCLREIDDRTDTTITNCLPVDVYAHVRVARSPSQACSFVSVLHYLPCFLFAMPTKTILDDIQDYSVLDCP